MKLFKNLLKTCQICWINKNKNYKNHNIARKISSTKSLEQIAIDFIGEIIETDRGNKYILIETDISSKFVKLYAC